MVQQAEENEVVEDVAEEQEEGIEVEQEEVEQTEPEQAEETESSDSGEVVVSIGDESPPSEESTEGLPAWVDEMRRAHRQKIYETRRLKAELARREAAAAPVVPPLGPKPTLEGADYDAEKFEEQLTAWHDRKRAADDAEKQKKEAAEADQKAWGEKLQAYAKQKAELKVADFEEAEAQVLEVLSPTQQAVILQGAKNAAAVICALGNNPGKLKELSAITNPVNFAFAVAELEPKVSIKPRKAAPMPETKLSGSGRTPISGDKKLAELEAKADKTGDRTELVAYRKSLVKRAA